jgi:glycosyltransferase involved in cell wall biosynthesis
MMVADIWPECLVQTGYASGGPALKMMFWLEKFGYKNCEAVAFTNPGARDHVRDHFLYFRDKFTVISNGVDAMIFKSELRSDDIRRKLRVGKDDF